MGGNFSWNVLFLYYRSGRNFEKYYIHRPVTISFQKHRFPQCCQRKSSNVPRTQIIQVTYVFNRSLTVNKAFSPSLWIKRLFQRRNDPKLFVPSIIQGPVFRYLLGHVTIYVKLRSLVSCLQLTSYFKWY